MLIRLANTMLLLTLLLLCSIGAVLAADHISKFNIGFTVTKGTEELSVYVDEACTTPFPATGGGYPVFMGNVQRGGTTVLQIYTKNTGVEILSADCIIGTLPEPICVFVTPSGPVLLLPGEVQYYEVSIFVPIETPVGSEVNFSLEFGW